MQKVCSFNEGGQVEEFWNSQGKKRSAHDLPLLIRAGAKLRGGGGRVFVRWCEGAEHSTLTLNL